MTDGTTKQIEYQKLDKYYHREKGEFNFDVDSEPHILEFQKLIGEDIIPIAKCVLNTNEHFPPKKKKDGGYGKAREYYDPKDITYKGKKVDYIKEHDYWEDVENEWLYCLTYNGRIVKIGMTISSLKERYMSYSCGTSRAMEKGSCSTTNYIISECNCYALLKGMEVKIYGIRCPKMTHEITRFGQTVTIALSSVRDQETMITHVFTKAYLHKPVLCVQVGSK